MEGLLFQIIFLIVVLTFYSILEYALQKHFHPKTTDKSSFLITTDYVIAFSIGIIELVIESHWFPFKNSYKNPFLYIGLVMIAVGLIIRFAAIVHAGSNFNHRIQFKKTDDHKLVTDGIYRYIRHPSYLGFLIFACGTQVFFSNPISTLGFYIKLYSWFDARIQIEERALCGMFPGAYEAYRAKTRTWMLIK